MIPMVVIRLALLVQGSLAPTAYDDGRSCPAECDAHVVVHRSHNGTVLVRLPSSPAGQPAACATGARCLICFTTGPGDCVETVYRGGGPAPGRADFTPAFFRAACGEVRIPPTLRPICRSARRGVATLAQRRNCFVESQAAECRDGMAAARARKAADDPRYQDCRRIGEPAFNRAHASEHSLQRALGCAYEKFGTGRSRNGRATWRRLLDGACRPGTFAGRDGLDCCSNDLWAAALFGRECAGYFPARVLVPQGPEELASPG